MIIFRPATPHQRITHQDITHRNITSAGLPLTGRYPRGETITASPAPIAAGACCLLARTAPATCPACLHSFTHEPVHWLIWRDAALTAVFAIVIFALLVFVLDRYQLISLAQLEAWQWPADIAARIGAALGWVEFS